MNAATTQAGNSGDAAGCFDPDGLPQAWRTAPDDSDTEAAPGLAEPDPSFSKKQPMGTALQASDAQLAQWMGAIADRDERALVALYDATFSCVIGIVHRVVHRTALAEEVVEETYFQVWRQAVRFDPARGSALGWLLAIARSRAIDALRHEARFRHEGLDEARVADAMDEAQSGDELLDLARNQADLHRALMLLGAQPRQLVSLAFFRGLSHEEIAQQMCLPLGTVKSQIRRALQSLRHILGSAGEGPAARLPALQALHA